MKLGGLIRRAEALRIALLLGLYVVGMPFLIAYKLPPRASLSRVDLTRASWAIQGGAGPWIFVAQSGTDQYRCSDLNADAVAAIRRSLAKPTDVTALVRPNRLYLGSFSGGPKRDFDICELVIGGSTVVPYAHAEYVVGTRRIQAIIVFTAMIGFATVMWVRKGRTPVVAAEATPF